MKADGSPDFGIPVKINTAIRNRPANKILFLTNNYSLCVNILFSFSSL